MYDYTKSKILLFKINKYDFYLLDGDVSNINKTFVNIVLEKLINKMNDKNKFKWFDVHKLNNFKICSTQIKDIMLNIFNKNATVIEKY